MLSIKMTSVTTVQFKGPLNKWNKSSIRPGPVGSVGDVRTSERIKQSMPDMDFAWSKKFKPENSMLRGSNVQDGRWYSFSTQGFNAAVKTKKIKRNGYFNTAVGMEFQNIIPEPRKMEPKLLDQPGYGWKSQAAEIVQRSGDMFTSLPGGYGPTRMTRGGVFPTNVSHSISRNTPTYLPSSGELIDSVVVKQEKF
jgi:hypothetical protein